MNRLVMKGTDMTRFLVLPIALVLATAAHAQHASPYADLVTREIKALSAEEIAQIRAGEGMGLALAAELNRYPGPKHVLELADSLALSAEQAVAIGNIERAMRAGAVDLGAELIARERELDRLFAAGTADSATVRGVVEAIGRTHGALRYAHLAAHLAVAGLLTAEQRHRYEMLRGYAAHAGAHAH